MSLKYKRLLEPGRIGGIEIPNRIIKAPQSTGLGQIDGSVSERLIRHYKELARGGTGLIIVESAYVDKIASKSSHCQLSICDNEDTPGLAWLAETIKDQGCRSAIQIDHCGRQKYLGTPPIKSASAVTWSTLYERVGADAIPEPLTLNEIEAIVAAFGDAALRARTAGFDCVEINGAHGYLITNFLSPHTNKRDDVYGGSLDNRMRLLIQVYSSIRSKVGQDFPVIARLSGTDYEPDGFGIDETVEVSKVLVSKGIDAIHVSGGDNNQMIHQVSPMSIPAGHNVWAAEALKREKGINVPIIASGSITTPELADDILFSSKGDFISLGRPLWADQYWVNKIKNGNPEDIRPCIRCNEGCLERTFYKFRSVACSVNHTLGREGEINITPAVKKKKIAVIGGGPAGMEAARVCALRAHDVTLYEKRKLGGFLNESSAPRFKSDLKPFMRYQQTQIKKLKIPVIEKEATLEVLADSGYDSIIIATGAKPMKLDVPGIDKSFVCEAANVFAGKAKLGKLVIVIGGNMIGTETALWLDAQDKNVVLLETSDQIMADGNTTDRIALGEKLTISNIQVHTDSQLEKITNKGVIVDCKGNKAEFQCDSVVLAVGYTPDTTLAEKLRKETDIDIHTVGNCVRTGKIFDAIHSAYKTAISI